MFDSRVTRVLQGQQVFLARAAARVILVSVAWAGKGDIHTQSSVMSDLQMLLVIVKHIILIKDVARQKSPN